MILVRPALVVPDDVIACGLPEDDRLRTSGVSGFAVFLRPTISVPRGVMYPAALDNDGTEVPAVAEDAGLVVLAPALLALAAPLADITVLDDDVMAAEEPDPVFFNVPYGEATENDVAPADGDPDVVFVAGVDGTARAVVYHVSPRPPGFVHRERGLAIRKPSLWIPRGIPHSRSSPDIRLSGPFLRGSGRCRRSFQASSSQGCHDSQLCIPGCQPDDSVAGKPRRHFF